MSTVQLEDSEYYKVYSMCNCRNKHMRPIELVLEPRLGNESGDNYAEVKRMQCGGRGSRT